MSHPLIHLRDVTKSFQTGELAVQILKGINLEIYAGEFVAIMGQSGSGKSTLMNILGCLDKPSSGDYLFDGKNIASFDADGLAQLRREDFGFVFQSYNLLAGVSACENVEMPAVYAGVTPKVRKQRASELLTRLGLAERLDHKPNQLSGGQQQRVSIARALINGGQIILADEPTGALDSNSGKEVIKLLKNLSADGHTIILITHDAEVAKNANRLIEIRDGLIISDPGPTIKDPDLTLKPNTSEPNWAFELIEASLTALRSMRNNIGRTALTLLGIVIGVSSVIAMLAIGDGAKKTVVESISAMGSNLLLVRPGGPNQRFRFDLYTLIPDDAVAIRQLPHVASAYPELTGNYTLRYGNVDVATDVNATGYAYPSARKWEIEKGTFFTADDENQYRTVAVLCKTAALKLFGNEEPVGKYIMIDKVMFLVIGVMSEKGADANGNDQDDKVLIPISTGSLRVFGRRYVRNITISVDDEDAMSDVQNAVTNLLISRHNSEDFTIRNMASLIDTLASTQNTMTILLGSIAAISLLVGGIGVMNIMLVSVTERTREIGVRMATGARHRNIMQQFLIEALMVSALGGVLGVTLGLLSAAIIDHFGTPVEYSVLPVLLAFSCAFLTGLIFGYLPARKASRLNPVIALASE